MGASRVLLVRTNAYGALVAGQVADPARQAPRGLHAPDCGHGSLAARRMGRRLARACPAVSCTPGRPGPGAPVPPPKPDPTPDAIATEVADGVEKRLKQIYS